ncbi:MAG: hypothetical protein A2351_07645 [Omnitrophica bacterium RIFOXYB12_FULL_50_7]|nr:MAG: hypothetical protein A2351_07645 [Omnitrophica bacterium RIFOXYB12_FULL_50_7]
MLVKTPLGTFLLETSPKGLYAVRFPAIRRGQAVTSCLSPLLRKLCHAKLDLSGYAPFQKKVYTVLMKVPTGKTITYGELAGRSGYPGAARAVGNAMKKNRLPIVIPCHRVVPSNGAVGDYSAGVKWKRWLLEYEKYSARLKITISKKQAPSKNQ